MDKHEIKTISEEAKNVKYPKQILRAFLAVTDGYDGEISCRIKKKFDNGAMYSVETDENAFDAVMYDNKPNIVFFREEGIVGGWKSTDFIPCVSTEDDMPQMMDMRYFLPAQMPSFVASESNKSVVQVLEKMRELGRMPTIPEMRQSGLSVDELAELSGKSRATVYNRAKKLGRNPTLEELMTPMKPGRHRKY